MKNEEEFLKIVFLVFLGVCFSFDFLVIKGFVILVVRGILEKMFCFNLGFSKSKFFVICFFCF